MAASARGVSNTRRSPNSSWRPSVTRNTPPSLPTSSPRTRLRGSSARESRRAWLMALTMVSSAIGLPVLLPGQPQGLLPLPGQVGREVGEHPREHLGHWAGPRPDDARPQALGELRAPGIDLLEEPGVGHPGALQPPPVPVQGILGLPPIDLVLDAI